MTTARIDLGRFEEYSPYGYAYVYPPQTNFQVWITDPTLLARMDNIEKKIDEIPKRLVDATP